MPDRESGGDRADAASRTVPPGNPAAVAGISMPRMSALLSIALNVQVAAKAIAPNRSSGLTVPEQMKNPQLCSGCNN